jgi:hypothetical protein
MAILRVPVAIVPSSQHYQARVGGQVTVGEVARYLSQHEAQLDVNTLEVARPARPDQRVEMLDIQGGDRLVIFSHAARPVDLPAPARPGDKTVRFSLGDTSLRSRGKKSLVVGKPEAGFIPDVDLRHFVTPRALEFVSADCMRLYFDEGAQVWYATRSGETRILLDELELERQPVALNDTQWVRFYSDARPLGDMRMTLETVQVGEDMPFLPPGQALVHLQIGLERDNQALRVSGGIRAGQIASSLAQHYGLPVGDDLRLYVARLAPPQTSLDALALEDDAMLYAALKLRYAEHILLLRDIEQRDHTYTLMAGQGEQLLGCRAQAAVPQPDLDVDLYESVIGQGYDPRPVPGMSPYFARITYRADEQSWWVWADGRAQVPLFVNNARASRGTALPLVSGDVVSIGPSLSHVYARLEVEG